MFLLSCEFYVTIRCLISPDIWYYVKTYAKSLIYFRHANMYIHIVLTYWCNVLEYADRGGSVAKKT